MAEVYKLQKNETLGGVAKKHGYTLAQLLALNPQINTKAKDWDKKLPIGLEIIVKPGPPPPESGGPIKGKGGKGFSLNYDGDGTKTPPKIETINPTSKFGRPASAVVEEDKWREGKEITDKKEVKIPVQVAVEAKPPAQPKVPEGPSWQEKVAMAIQDANEDPTGSIVRSVSKIANHFGMNEAEAKRLGRDAAGLFHMSGIAGGAALGAGRFGTRITDPRHAPIDPLMKGWRQGMNRPPAGQVSVVGERPLVPTSLTPQSLAKGPPVQTPAEPRMGLTLDSLPTPPVPSLRGPNPTVVQTPPPPVPSLTGGAPLTSELPAATGVPARPVFGGREPPSLSDRSMRPGVRGKLENTLIGNKTKRKAFENEKKNIDPAFTEAIEGKVGSLNTPDPLFVPANQINTVKDMGRVMRAAKDKTVVLENASDLGFASDRVLIVHGKRGGGKIDPEAVLDSDSVPVLTQAMFANVLKHIGFK